MTDTGTMDGVRERLAQPLPYPAPPVIIPDGKHAEWLQAADEVRAMAPAHEELVDGWHYQAVGATFGPLLDWLRRGCVPAMLP